jgi:O-antigen ligase
VEVPSNGAGYGSRKPSRERECQAGHALAGDLEKRRKMDAINNQADEATAPGGVMLLPGGAAVVILLVLFLTLTPFPDLSDPRLLDATTGNEATTYVVLLSLAAFAGFLLRERLSFIISAFHRREYLVMSGLLALSVVLSVDPAASVRRLVLAATTFSLAAMLPWLTGGVRQFTMLLAVTFATVLALSWFGVIVIPRLAIHQPFDIVEPEIAGDWRGVFGHKNVTAGAMAVFAYVGWFVARNSRPVSGTIMAAAALVFLIFTHGKSALGMFFLASAVGFAIDRARSLPARILLALGPLAILNLLTVGSAMSDSLHGLVSALPIDTTFTGRTDIWRFAFDAIHAHPFTGTGFDAFWYSSGVRNGDDATMRWMGDVASSHNSYVDLTLTIGLPGLLAVIAAFVVLPLRDFHSAWSVRENREFARLLLILWLFSLYDGTFEAFILNRTNPMWFVIALAVCGLRYAASYDIRR